MRNNEQIFSIIQKIAEREGYPINYVLSNIQYFSDKYSASISGKEIDNLKNHLRVKVNLNEFTTLKLTRY